MGSHLGRAFAGAYRGDGECAGGFGVEFGALAWPAVSGGASLAIALRRSSYGCGCARERREEGEARATERVERPGGSGRRPDQVNPVGRGASTTPAYGRHVAVAGWDEAGATRAGEREGGGRPGRCLGRKGGGVGPAAPAPFSIFFNFFSQVLF